MKRLLTIVGLLISQTVWPQTQNYELTDQDSVDIYAANPELIFDENRRPLTTIDGLMINNCSTGSCLLTPGLTHQVTVVTSDTVRCRLDVPELSWQELWTGSGSRQLTTPVIDRDVTVTVTCENRQMDQVSQSLAVQLAPENCSNSVYPVGLNPRAGDYAAYNDGFEFGTSTNTSFLATISVNEFLALDGISLPADTRRRFIFAEAPTQLLLNVSTISVSLCPGDFTDSDTICKYQVSNNSDLFFSTRPADASSPIPFCILDAGTRYYINFVHSPSPYTTAPSCQSGTSSCTFFGAERAISR